jgi:hypothetical protein
VCVVTTSFRVLTCVVLADSSWGARANLAALFNIIGRAEAQRRIRERLGIPLSGYEHEQLFKDDAAREAVSEKRKEVSSKQHSAVVVRDRRAVAEEHKAAKQQLKHTNTVRSTFYGADHTTTPATAEGKKRSTTNGKRIDTNDPKLLENGTVWRCEQCKKNYVKKSTSQKAHNKKQHSTTSSSSSTTVAVSKKRKQPAPLTAAAAAAAQEQATTTSSSSNSSSMPSAAASAWPAKKKRRQAVLPPAPSATRRSSTRSSAVHARAEFIADFDSGDDDDGHVAIEVDDDEFIGSDTDAIAIDDDF